MPKRSDALVFFGATGDLAYKKVFPALHAMARRGRRPGVGAGPQPHDPRVLPRGERAEAERPVTEAGGWNTPP